MIISKKVIHATTHLYKNLKQTSKSIRYRIYKRPTLLHFSEIVEDAFTTHQVQKLMHHVYYKCNNPDEEETFKDYALRYRRDPKLKSECFLCSNRESCEYK